MTGTLDRTSAIVPDRWGRSVGPDNIVLRALYERWFRVEWDGIEHVPRRGGALLVSNHAGLMPVDGGIVPLGIESETGRPVYPLGHHGFWRLPFVGQLMSAMGGVVGHPDNAHRLLTEDESLVLVFPEGGKGPGKPPRERYRLQRFGRGGFVETAMRAGVPIVPIALMGTEDTTPTLASFRLLGQDVPLSVNTLLLGPILGPLVPFTAKIRARVLPPLHFDEPPNRDHYPTSLLMEHSEEIRGRLQRALDRMLQQRESIFRG
jgi:1-acyl-sn-glycerol-3-phosphate acyltransferase